MTIESAGSSVKVILTIRSFESVKLATKHDNVRDLSGLTANLKLYLLLQHSEDVNTSPVSDEFDRSVVDIGIARTNERVHSRTLWKSSIETDDRPM